VTAPARATGMVVWFDDAKGFGFIRPKHGDDVFVHYREVVAPGRRSLVAGELVEYALTETERGPAARSVMRTECLPTDEDGKLEYRIRAALLQWWRARQEARPAAVEHFERVLEQLARRCAGA